MSLHDIYEYRDGKLYNKEDRSSRARKGQEAGNPFLHQTRWQVRFEGRRIQRSHAVWIMHNGPIPEGMEVDHINGDSMDDRIENLRLATSAQQKWNTASKNGLPKGVGYDKSRDRYTADLMVNGTRYRLGRFKTLEAAKEAYQAKARELQGEFYADRSGKSAASVMV